MNDFLGLEPNVIKFIEKNVEQLYICCSGGADSIYLTVSIQKLFPNRQLNILHYNHAIRQESDEEAIGVQSLAKAINANFFYEKRQTTNDNVTEELLRADRYAFFKKILEQNGGNCLILGQHLNDRAESLLMRIARGSGLSGLIAPKAIQEFSDGHIRLRPLINLKKAKIEQELTNLGIKFFVDKSNFTEQFLRNAIRLRVFPVLNEIFHNRDWLNGVKRSINMLEESSNALSYFYNKELNNVDFSAPKLNIAEFIDKPIGLLRELITKWFVHHKILENLKADTLDKILTSISSKNSFKISAGKNKFVKLKCKTKSISIEIIYI